MSKNVAQIFGKQSRRKVDSPHVEWPMPEQLVGLEIEVENTAFTKHPYAYDVFWSKTKDGSLRNGVEYVLRMPLKGDTLSRAIHEIFDGAQFERSTTGSTHIHLDMLEENTTQNTVKVLVLMMYIFESAIFALADRGREWCGYTNKLASAPEMLVGAVLNASEDDNYQELEVLCADRGAQVGRYYGINVLALAKYGSLEFRYFPTAVSSAEIIDWVCLMQTFKMAALELGTPDALMVVMQDAGLYDEFLNRYFAKWKDYFVQEVPQYVGLSSMHKALAIASTHAMNKNIKPNSVRFDERAITSNKLLDKFVKNKTKNNVPPLIITAPSEGAPDCHAAKPGTVLIHCARVYISSSREWVAHPFSDDGYNAFSDAHRRAGFNCMKRYAASAMDILTQQGRGVGDVTLCMRRLGEAMDYIAHHYGETLTQATPSPYTIRGVSLADMVALQNVTSTTFVVESNEEETPDWAEQDEGDDE